MTKLILSAIGALGILASLVILIFKRLWSKEAEDKKTIKKTDMNDLSSITSTFDKINRILIIGVFLFLSGCSKSIILHPIEQADIMQVKQGITYEAPKDGYFLSEFYIKEVMQAKVK